MPGYEPVLGPLPVVIALDIKLDDGANCELCALALRQEAVTMDEEIPGEAIGVDEAPRALEGADVTTQPVPDPVARAEQGTRGDLLCDRAPTVVKGHVKLHRLPRTYWGLAVAHLVWHWKEVVAVHEKVTVKGRSIQEAPTFGKAPHIATVSLAQNVCGPATEYRLHCHCMWTSMVISLHIKLNGFTLTEWVALKLGHDAVSSEQELPLEHVAFHKTPPIAGCVFGDDAVEPLMFEIQGRLDWQRHHSFAAFRSHQRHCRCTHSQVWRLPVLHLLFDLGRTAW
mmetsp:Transcript_53604/g.124749  ORF Transcript_53604/g.124749 Transcript_53604/m.124749 type:complete len:283 (-) Transcript_53604:262-1110(-)